MPHFWFGQNVRGKRNMCPRARSHGISLLHGNHVAFLSGFDRLFKTIFKFMENLNLRNINLELMIKSLNTSLAAVEKKDNKQGLEECNSVRGIREMILLRIRRIVDRNEKY